MKVEYLGKLFVFNFNGDRRYVDNMGRSNAHDAKVSASLHRGVGALHRQLSYQSLTNQNLLIQILLSDMLKTFK